MSYNKDADPQRLADVLPNNTLAKILDHSQNLMKIEPTIQAALPREYIGLYQLMNLRENTLVLAAASAAIATKIRYSKFELLAAMDGQTYPSVINDIIIKIKPELFTHPDTQKPLRPHLSTTARSLLRQTADRITDPELASALNKLALDP